MTMAFIGIAHTHTQRRVFDSDCLPISFDSLRLKKHKWEEKVTSQNPGQSRKIWVKTIFVYDESKWRENTITIDWSVVTLSFLQSVFYFLCILDALEWWWLIKTSSLYKPTMIRGKFLQPSIVSPIKREIEGEGLIQRFSRSKIALYTEFHITIRFCADHSTQV